jgi:predicted esterase
MSLFQLADTKFILPTAPQRAISLNSGYMMNGWSDISGLTETATEDRAGFEESAARVNGIIQQEIDKGIPASKIVVGGFSQGGALVGREQ